MKKSISSEDYIAMKTLFKFEPVKGFKCGSNMGIYWGRNESAGKYVLNLLKAFNLSEGKSVVERVTIIKTRVNKEVAIVAEVLKSRV